MAVGYDKLIEQEELRDIIETGILAQPGKYRDWHSWNLICVPQLKGWRYVLSRLRGEVTPAKFKLEVILIGSHGRQNNGS
jgi:hypothetical protein